MGNKKLAKNTLLYSIGTLLPQVAAFILLPIYTRFLSPSDYGVLNSVQVISSILAIIYTLSIDKAIYRLYFDFKTEKLKKDYLGTVFITVTFSVTLITSLLFIFPGVLGTIYKDITFYPYISLSVIATSLATFVIIPRAVYFVQEKANKFILISLAEFFLRNAFIVFFVVYSSKGVKGYLLGQIVGSAIMVPILLFIVSKQINFVFVKSYIKSSLRYSIPMLPTFVSVWVISAIDRVFIERYFDVRDVGIYSLGYKIAMLVSVVSGAFYKAYNPYYFKLATTGIKEEILPQLKKTNTVYVLLVIVTSSMIALFSKEAVYLFFDNRYYESYKIISIVSLSFAIASFGGIFNLAIYQEKKTMFLMYINIIGAFVNIGLNFLFISNYGAYGAAWATVITYFVIILMSYYYAKKCFYASFNSKIVSVVFSGLVLINLLFYYIDLQFWIALIMKFLSIFIILLFIWLKFKVEIFSIIKKNN